MPVIGEKDFTAACGVSDGIIQDIRIRSMASTPLALFASCEVVAPDVNPGRLCTVNTIYIV